MTRQRYNNLLKRSENKDIIPPNWNEFSYLVRRSFQNGFKCVYCGITMKLNGGGNDIFTIDHVIPLSMGGTNEIKNLCVCCRECNYSKGKLESKEYMETINWRNLWQSLFQSG